MSEVFENNAALTSVRNFYFNYQRIILSVFFSLIFLVSAFLFNMQIQEKKMRKLLLYIINGFLKKKKHPMVKKLQINYFLNLPQNTEIQAIQK